MYSLALKFRVTLTTYDVDAASCFSLNRELKHIHNVHMCVFLPHSVEKLQ